MSEAFPLLCTCGCNTFTVAAIDPEMRPDKPESRLLGRAGALIATCTACSKQVTMKVGVRLEHITAR